MNSILAFVIVLGVLVFIHEFGHFLLARLCGVGVEIFSLGFGPRLAGKTVGRTDYRISGIPLGGFVKMVGEEPDAELPPEDIPVAFNHKPVFQRILIVAAGPAFNLLLAALIFFVIFQVSGVSRLEPTIGEVKAGTPADRAGLREGDKIVQIDGEPVATWEKMSQFIRESGGKTLGITVARDAGQFHVQMAPERTAVPNLFGEETERYVVGITAGGEVFNQRLNPLEALGQSVVQTWRIAELTVVSVAKLIAGSLSADTLGGPIMIAQMAGEQAREGAANLVFFIALLSINLAILNILPIPVLDGGHLLFFVIEAVRGRPVSTRVREMAQQAGVFVLLLLMIFVFYNDISRLFSAS
ncbi:MAG: RIP metalloprotease RseP [Desulfococcaceae bacterium]